MMEGSETPAELNIISDDRIIEIVYRGSPSFDQYMEIIHKAYDMTLDRDIRLCLADNRGIEKDPSVFEIFRMPKRMESAGMPKKGRIAVLIKEETPKGIGAYFFETTCRNRGYNVKLFKDRVEAIEWLQEFGK